MLVRNFFGLVDLHRDEKFVSLRFRAPFKVISTSAAEGGLREGLDLVFNHQSCEPRFHTMPALLAAHRKAARYSAEMMKRHGLAGSRAAGLGTAAEMNNLCIAEESYRELTVAALATGGVETNAARAGDPASYYEYNGAFEKRGGIGPEKPGTINVIVLVNTPLAEGALVRAVMTATEGKTAALQELSVPSRQSAGLATGTGTDQIAIAAPVSGAAPLTSAGHHSALGELIGRTVRDAVKQTLAFQNRLTAASQGSVGRLLERFGMDADGFAAALAEVLPAGVAALAADNRETIDREPLTVAGVAALAHVRDQVTWGMLPPLCWREAAVDHGALIASAAAGQPARMADFREALAQAVAETGRDDLPFIAVRAVALGYAEKWRATEAMLAAVAAEESAEAAQ
ncbi:adenosylcobinamide amidohydrolase [Oleispirillum naphthae]|uniref:adenosylcobinamide amidohydrolase n=1 Tax=Oleispirillum naphthae TaxID=2838853 RepID=UPI00308221C6